MVTYKGQCKGRIYFQTRVIAKTKRELSVSTLCLIIWPHHPRYFSIYFEYVIFKSIFLYSPLFCELPVPRNLCFRYTEVISLSLSLSLVLSLFLGHVIWSSTSGLRPWEQFLMESIEFGFRYLELSKKRIYWDLYLISKFNPIYMYYCITQLKFSPHLHQHSLNTSQIAPKSANSASL